MGQRASDDDTCQKVRKVPGEEFRLHAHFFCVLENVLKCQDDHCLFVVDEAGESGKDAIRVHTTLNTCLSMMRFAEYSRRLSLLPDLDQVGCFTIRRSTCVVSCIGDTVNAPGYARYSWTFFSSIPTPKERYPGLMLDFIYENRHMSISE